MFFIIRFKISLKVLTRIAAIMKNTVTQGKVPLPLKYTASLSLQVIFFGVLTHYSLVLVIYTP